MACGSLGSLPAREAGTVVGVTASLPFRLPLSAMASVLPIATVLALPDGQPLAPRLRTALMLLSEERLQDLERQLDSEGRAVVARGEPAAVEPVAAALRRAGLTLSVNLLVPSRVPPRLSPQVMGAGA